MDGIIPAICLDVGEECKVRETVTGSGSPAREAHGLIITPQVAHVLSCAWFAIRTRTPATKEKAECMCQVRSHATDAIACDRTSSANPGRNVDVDADAFALNIKFVHYLRSHEIARQQN